MGSNCNYCRKITPTTKGDCVFCGLSKVFYGSYLETLDRKGYYVHWITNLVSQELKEELDFCEWVKGFEERYTQDELGAMNEAWKGY